MQGLPSFRPFCFAFRKPARTRSWSKSRMYATVIYAKDAVRLEELEEMLGRDKFRTFLATLVRT